MGKLISCGKALDYCAQAMDNLSPDDLAREDVRTIYLVAGHIQAADQIARMRIQTDDRIWVPDWLVKRYSAGSETPND